MGLSQSRPSKPASPAPAMERDSIPEDCSGLEPPHKRARGAAAAPPLPLQGGTSPQHPAAAGQQAPRLATLPLDVQWALVAAMMQEDELTNVFTVAQDIAALATTCRRARG